MNHISLNQSSLPNCPECRENDWKKSGFDDSVQRYQCNHCGSAITDKTVEKLKKKLELFVDFFLIEANKEEGLSDSEITKRWESLDGTIVAELANRHGISIGTVASWIKEYKANKDLQEEVFITVAQGITYKGKKPLKCGFYFNYIKY